MRFGVFVLAALTILLLAIPKADAGYPAGYTDGAYTYDGAYWVNAGNAYSWVDGYYVQRNGCWVAVAGHYQLAKTGYVVPARKKLDRTVFLQDTLGVVKKSIEQDYEYAADAADAAFVQATLNQLGLARPNGLNAYGSAYASLYAGHYQLGAYNVIPNGTIYGSYKSQIVAQGDPAVDLNALTQSQQATVQSAMGLTDKISERSTEVVRLVAAEEEKRKALDAQYRAKLATVEAIMRGTPSVTITTETKKTTPAGVPSQAVPQVMPKIADAPPAGLKLDPDRVNKLEAVFEAKGCIKCHDQKSPQGGFVIQTIGESESNMAKAFAYVRPDKPETARCPKGGKPLSWDEALLFHVAPAKP